MINNFFVIFSFSQPALFESIVTETIQHLHEVIQAKPAENEASLTDTTRFMNACITVEDTNSSG